MPQSSYIAAYLIVGFLVFITARGELASYLAVVFGKAKTPATKTTPAAPTTTPPTNTSSSTGTINI